MELSPIEQQVIANMHRLPQDKQQSLLEFSLFLIDTAQNSAKKKAAVNDTFATFLATFLNEVANEPLDIDTAIFDKDRPLERDRAIDL